jgi:predicted histidine transporter YuiF (NhaC family)
MIWKREPALFYGLVNSILALVLAFGVQLSTEQTGAILAATSALLALLTRRTVYSPHTVQEAMKPSPEELYPGTDEPA